MLQYIVGCISAEFAGLFPFSLALCVVCQLHPLLVLMSGHQNASEVTA